MSKLFFSLDTTEFPILQTWLINMLPHTKMCQSVHVVTGKNVICSINRLLQLATEEL